ncbi:MAG: hypothetical protein QM704_15615 [Anaeromyxobacteraceae bacterium]
MLVAALLVAAGPSRGETVAVPIARLSLWGGWDSNALYEGRGGDRAGRLSPELGVRLMNERLDLKLSGGADLLVYERYDRGGTWNPRAALSLDGRGDRRLTVGLTGNFQHAFDPAGLAQLGVFRTGRASATTVEGRGRLAWRATERLEVAGTYADRTVRFDDGSGGAMHAPGLEALYRVLPRVAVGAAGGVALFQGFAATGDEHAFSSSGRARLRVDLDRRLRLEAAAGPALWSGPDGRAVVPEGTAELRAGYRTWDLAATLFHGLGIGSTARPGLVTSAEVAAEKRFGLWLALRGRAGVWRSGRAPGGEDAVEGYAASAEAAAYAGGGVRVLLSATRFARIDDPSPALGRTTVGLGLSWELEPR